MKPTDQIAAELDHALIEFSRKKYPVLSQRERKKTRIAIIQSYIEKATEPFKRQLESAGNLESQLVNLKRSRTAHASEGKGKP